MAKIQLNHIIKSYDEKNRIFDDFSVCFDEREFIAILGPSGCGKSTLLRLIAGLENFDSGQILIDGEDVSKKDPKDRDIAMVFQNYALYPHKTVYQNLEFGLKMRKVPEAERQKRIQEAADILDISVLLKRRPKELSGGQRQRVALGRALVRQPKLFLLDEPLSNLDAKLRVKMRSEIIRLYQQVNQTMIYVTHDQTEAMTMGTKILLLNQGVIQQYDQPEQLYEYPANLFVAQFIGSPQMNIFVLPVLDKYVSLAGFRLAVPEAYSKEKIYLGIRPENIQLIEGDSFTISHIENLGNERLVYLQGNQMELCLRDYHKKELQVGDLFGIEVSNQYLHWFDFMTKERVN